MKLTIKSVQDMLRSSKREVRIDLFRGLAEAMAVVERADPHAYGRTLAHLRNGLMNPVHVFQDICIQMGVQPKKGFTLGDAA